MMIKTIILIFAAILQTLLLAQEQAALKIVVSAPAVEEGSIIYIAGNLPELGSWFPGKVPLKREDSLWTISFMLNKGTDIEFKFTKGSWQKEAVGETGMILQNYSVKLISDTTLYYRITRWKDEAEPGPVFEGQITGTVEYCRILGYKELRERELAVWLPPGYYSQDSARYPVLYMQDGQNMFDPSMSAFGVDWQIDEAADSLIRKGEIQPIIIVGIYNTRDRSREYLPNDTADVYMDYMIKRVKFFVDSRYRTLPGPDFTAVGGSSAGGTLAFMTVWEHPEVFSKAICLSSAFKIRKIDYLTAVRNYEGPKKKIKLYIDIGGRGIDSALQKGNNEMISLLRAKGFTEDADFLFKAFEDHQHTEGDWAKRIPDALRFIFGNPGD